MPLFSARVARLFGALLLVAVASAGAFAQTKAPLKLGFGMALTGGLAGNGKAALLAMQLWQQKGVSACL